MALTPMDIHNKEFNVRMRGYDQDQVNDFLDQIIKDYDALLKENEKLKASLKSSQEKVTYFNDLKDALNQSIIVAQETADKVKNNANNEADIIRNQAEKDAQKTLNDATEKSNHILEDASAKSRQIAGETDDLKKQTRVFRQRLQVMLESQLEVVKSPEWNELLSSEEENMPSNEQAIDPSMSMNDSQPLNEQTPFGQVPFTPESSQSTEQPNQDSARYPDPAPAPSEGDTPTSQTIDLAKQSAQTTFTSTADSENSSYETTIIFPDSQMSQNAFSNGSAFDQTEGSQEDK